MTDLLRAIVLGVTEGATEFIPVSSTGHLILAGRLIGFAGPQAALFEIVIQLGAILAVVWNYRTVLSRWVHQAVVANEGTAAARQLFLGLAIAFAPAAIVGIAAHRWIIAHLFAPVTVGVALILGGAGILFVERFKPEPRVGEVTRIPRRVALAIGMVQLLSLIPGASRSGATIMGGLALGIARPQATEFSFLLAIPVMFAATGLAALEQLSAIRREDLWVFGVGFAAAFVSALLVIRWLLRFVAQHSFVGFAWYRIAIGLVTLVVLGLPGPALVAR
jgi:undecaprenyl-diphosphatase